MPDPTPILSKEQLLKVQYEYESGTFKSLTELASRYGISVQTLHARIKREKWDVKRQNMLLKVDKKFEEIKVNHAQVWMDKVKARTEVDWNIIDRSIDNIGSEVDPDTMLTSVRARKVLDDMHRRSLGLADPSQQVDVTSKGQSIGESMVSAIAKLRDSNAAVTITTEQVAQLADYEIVKDDQVTEIPNTDTK